MSQPALMLRDISKSFHGNTAIKEISLELHKGEICALIGPNGAGKTTLLRLVTGVLAPDEGEIKIGQHSLRDEPQKAKHQLGYMPDDPTVFPYLTGRELIFMTGTLFGASEREIEKRLKEFLNLFPILSVLDQPLSFQSRGTKQKILFIATLIHSPKLLIIDEPLVGLDPMSVVAFGKTLKAYAQQGGAVLIALHTLQFAQDIADSFAFVHHGKLVQSGPVGKKSLESEYVQLLRES